MILMISFLLFMATPQEETLTLFYPDSLYSWPITTPEKGDAPWESQK